MRDLHQRCGPSIINAYEFAKQARGESRLGQVSTVIDGEWVPCRPLGGLVFWRAVWLVFTGRADALVWPGQGYAPPPPGASE